MPIPSCSIATAAIRSAGRCCIARQLVEAGVNLVQVNLGNNETWDTHGNAFPHPEELSVSADRSGRVGLARRSCRARPAGFDADRDGRRNGPHAEDLDAAAILRGKPGRDHWGTQTVFFAGGGVRGGTVIGSTDKIGAFPAANPQKPENMAATIYQALGIPRTLAWHDATDRPHFVYHGEPIPGLTESGA